MWQSKYSGLNQSKASFSKLTTYNHDNDDRLKGDQEELSGVGVLILTTT